MNDNQLEVKSKDLFKKINRIKPINNIDSLREDFVAEDELGSEIVYFSGENSKKQYVSYDLPLDIFKDSEKEREYLNKLRKEEGKAIPPKTNKILNAIEQYEELKEMLESEAMKLLSEINEIESISGYSMLSVSNIEDGCIQYFGEERWNYGGYDSSNFEIPLELIYDSEAKEEYLNKRKLRVEKQDLIKKEQKELAEKKKKESDRKKYLELKNQFEEGK